MRALRSELVEARRIARRFGPRLVAGSLRTTAEAVAAGFAVAFVTVLAMAGGA